MNISNPSFKNDDLKIGDIILFAGVYYIISSQEYDKGLFLYNLDTNSNEESFECMEHLIEYFDLHEIKKVKSLTIGG